MTSTEFRTQPAAVQPAGPYRAAGAGGALRPLLVDLGVPLASYYVLRAAGCGLVITLALSSVLPAVRAVSGLVRNRALNGFAVLIVAVNVVSIAISFWSGNPRIMLAKDGAVTSTIGIAILLSVLAGRPLMTAGLRPFIVKAASPRFRRDHGVLSTVLTAGSIGAGIVAGSFFSIPMEAMVRQQAVRG